ncbi:MAG: hypothetical protein UY44_C0018G0001, partial [Candidatus Kaiserbacteria bacterium GW2011_GWA2_49_19]
MMLTSVFLFLTLYSLYPVFATPPSTYYTPGETLDPNCAPGDPNCAVYPPLSTTITTSTNVIIGTSTLNFGGGLFYLDGANNLIGIGTTTPAAKLHVVTTTEQLRLGYNRSSYTSFTIGLDGALVVSSTGNVTTTFSNALAISGTTSLASILNVTGHTTLSTVSSTNGTFSG